MGDTLSLLMFLTTCGVLLLGFPVAFALSGTAFAFAMLGVGLDVFDIRLLGGLASRFFGVMVNEVLVAVPLFVFMGVMLERSRVAEQLLETLGLLFGRLRGGLGISVILVGMLMAASTGIVGATVVTMGLLSLPDHAKDRLRSQARLRNHLRLGHAGADHSALDRADALGRHPPGRLQPGTACDRQFRAGPGLGGGSLCRRFPARDHASGALHGLAGDHGVGAPQNLSAGAPCRGRGPRSPRPGGQGLAAADVPGYRRPGLDPRRHRDADRIGGGRRDPAGGAPTPAHP